LPRIAGGYRSSTYERTEATMSESYGTGDERDDLGEYDVEENREADDEDEDEDGGGYGASEQGDADVEGPGDQSGMGDVDDEADEVGAR
jgi:hypothetical protein